MTRINPAIIFMFLVLLYAALILRLFQKSRSTKAQDEDAQDDCGLAEEGIAGEEDKTGDMVSLPPDICTTARCKVIIILDRIPDDLYKLWDALAIHGIARVSESIDPDHQRLDGTISIFNYYTHFLGRIRFRSIEPRVLGNHAPSPRLRYFLIDERERQIPQDLVALGIKDIALDSAVVYTQEELARKAGGEAGEPEAGAGKPYAQHT